MASETIRKAALEWIESNTTFSISSEPLPASIELFIEKYGELMGLRAGIASENISGLSQSFSTGDISSLLKSYARELIGEEYMPSDIKVIPALEPWVY